MGESWINGLGLKERAPSWVPQEIVECDGAQECVGLLQLLGFQRHFLLFSPPLSGSPRNGSHELRWREMEWWGPVFGANGTYSAK